jgi:hypothetical protein
MYCLFFFFLNILHGLRNRDAYAWAGADYLFVSLNTVANWRTNSPSGPITKIYQSVFRFDGRERNARRQFEAGRPMVVFFKLATSVHGR